MEYSYDRMREPLIHSRSSSLNARPVVGQEHKRRKVSVTPDDCSSGTWRFDAVQLFPAPCPKTFTFFPISSILRAHLPLSWLASSVSYGPQAGSILKADIPGVSRWDYHILVTRLASGEKHFAFERIDVGTYTCHPLQDWVTSQWIEQAAIGAAPPVNLDLLLHTSRYEHSHSRKASATSLVGATISSPTAESPKVPKSRRGQLARLSILESRERTEEPLDLSCDNNREVDSQSELVINPDQSGQPTANVLVEADPRKDSGGKATCVLPAETATSQYDPPLSLEPCVPTDPITPVDHLSAEHLRRQYLETLYVTKTSLAFFAKGPLSRARARARIANASRSSEGLAQFYYESIVPTKKIDVKYKESIQNKIRAIVTIEENEVERSGPSRAPRKARRSKIGKDGLWPMEDEYIEKWWEKQEFVGESTHTASALSAQMQKLIGQLRMRETEMQILLILEVLALEARDIPAQKALEIPAAPSIKVEPVDVGESNGLSKSPMPAKKRNLKSELDTLVDRLCIWHSVSFEDLDTIHAEMQTSGSSTNKLKDRLRDFCKDVIVPFYGGKLFEECQAICTKMGGPMMSPRRTRDEPEKEPKWPVPGTALTHGQPRKKRDLQRVLSEDQNIRHASPPGLIRSATLPMSGDAKRESSERPKSRSAMQKSVSFSNREVDLVADARVSAAKRRKLELVAVQKKELDAAIENLKRPNRSNIARNFMDDVEQRGTENKAVAKKKEPVQISATPRRNRKMLLDADDYDLPSMPALSAPPHEPCVPSSTTKPKGLDYILSSIPRSSIKKRAVLSAIHDTPSRATSKQNKMSFADVGMNPGRSSCSTLVTSTPTTSRIRSDILSDNIVATPMQMSRSLRPVLLTSMDRSEVDIEHVFKDAPEIPARAGKMMDRAMGSRADAVDLSLYESLGWNDDYDL